MMPNCSNRIPFLASESGIAWFGLSLPRCLDWRFLGLSKNGSCMKWKLSEYGKECTCRLRSASQWSLKSLGNFILPLRSVLRFLCQDRQKLMTKCHQQRTLLTYANHFYCHLFYKILSFRFWPLWSFEKYHFYFLVFESCATESEGWWLMWFWVPHWVVASPDQMRVILTSWD